MEQTSELDPAPVSGSAFSSEAILDQLQKVLTSQAFRAAQGQRAFLQYAVEQTAQGRGNTLKEFVIGIEALGRGPSFDPRLDPIVRTQARKLRARLAKYYETEGLSDDIRIEFPKGCYSPCFQAVQPQQAPLDETHLKESQLQSSLDEPDETVAPLAAQAPPIALSDTVALPAQARHPIFPVLLASFILLATCAAVFLYRRQTAPAHAPRDYASIAVMPLVNLGDQQSDEFISDGLTDELIASLRGVPGLQVVAHSSVFWFKAKPVDLKAIEQKLHVHTVLLGNVKRSQNRLRVTVQLNTVPGGDHLWTGSYDRESNDLQAVQGEISKSVADVLGMSLSKAANGDLLGLPKRTLPNSAAHESYLKGLHFWNKFTARDLQTATVYFKQAIAEDPSYAHAYAALADCFVMAPQVAVGTDPPQEIAARIRKSATQALALDNSLGEAHIDLAISAEYDFDWAKAEAEFRKGLQLSPGNAVGHLWYSKYLALMGRKPEVLVQRRKAEELDPVSAYAAQSVAGYFSVVGHYDAAILRFRDALALEPNFGLAHQGLGFTYLLAGRHAEALQELQIAQDLLHGPYRKAVLAYAYAVSGDTAEARRILDGFLQQASQAPFPAVAIADIYIGLGDKDHAFQWLEKAVDQRDLTLDLQWDPLYAPVRLDPRYPILLRRMKLA